MNVPRRPDFYAETRSRNEITPEMEKAIRQRAYELYVQRGKQAGHDLEDWLRAEAEVIGRHRKTVAA